MNFCTQSLGTTISTDQEVEDGFNVNNLITNSNDQLSNSFLPSSTVTTTTSINPNNYNNNTGFMTIRFVRPPVKLKLDFPVPIEVSHIVICPTVGQQSSSGFQIDTIITGRAKTPEEKYSISTHTIAREFINTAPVPNIIVFKNPRFQLKAQYHSLPLRKFELHRNFPKAFQLKHSSFYACEKVISLELTILKVNGSSIPALGLLQVWGQPSIHCSKLQIQKLLEAWLPIIKTKKGSLTSSSDATKSGGGHKRKSSESDLYNFNYPSCIKEKRLKTSTDPSDSAIVPEEFLDPITYEIMCQPLRLPSGVAVDLTTLEKYNSEEGMWGRPPNDPFTGVQFNDNTQPVLDASLKSRIDIFLNQNSNDVRFYNLPRTLGFYSNTKNPNIKTCTYTNTSGMLPQYTISNEQRLMPSSLCSEPSKTDSQSLLNYELEKYFGKGKEGNNFLFIKPKTPPETHGGDVKSKIINCCTKCEKPCNTSTVSLSFYTTICRHVIICRPCLILFDKLNENICKICKLKWSVKDLSKLNYTNLKLFNK